MLIPSQMALLIFNRADAVVRMIVHPYHHLLLLFTRMLHDLELKKSFNRADVEKCPI